MHFDEALAQKNSSSVVTCHSFDCDSKVMQQL
jgi:hypothetical protein